MATPQDLLRQAGRGPSYSPEAQDWRRQRKEQQKAQPPDPMSKPAVRPAGPPSGPITRFPTNPQPPGGASPPILAKPLGGGAAQNMGRFVPNEVNPGDLGPGTVGHGAGIQQLDGAAGSKSPAMPPGVDGPPTPIGGPMTVSPIGGAMPPPGGGIGIGAPQPGMSGAPGMDSGGGGNPFPGFRPGPPVATAPMVPFHPGGPAGPPPVVASGMGGTGIGFAQQMQHPPQGPPSPQSPFQSIGNIAARMQPSQFQPQQPQRPQQMRPGVQPRMGATGF